MAKRRNESLGYGAFVFCSSRMISPIPSNASSSFSTRKCPTSKYSRWRSSDSKADLLRRSCQGSSEESAASASHGTSGSRRRLTHESFLSEFNSVEASAGAARLLDVAVKSGAQLGWGSSSVNCSDRLPGVDVSRHRRMAPPYHLYRRDGWASEYVSFGAAIFTGYDSHAWRRVEAISSTGG